MKEVELAGEEVAELGATAVKAAEMENLGETAVKIALALPTWQR